LDIMIFLSVHFQNGLLKKREF